MHQGVKAGIKAEERVKENLNLRKEERVEKEDQKVKENPQKERVKEERVKKDQKEKEERVKKEDNLIFFIYML